MEILRSINPVELQDSWQLVQYFSTTSNSEKVSIIFNLCKTHSKHVLALQENLLHYFFYAKNGNLRASGNV